MLPNFPNSKKLEIIDKEEIEKITKKYSPYSDFNFVSMYSYNTENDLSISCLYDNLIIKIRDYITNEPLYSFIGNNNSDQVIKLLLQQSLKEGLKPELKLIPEISLPKNYKTEKTITITEDKDNFDYILSLQSVSQMQDEGWYNKRKKINRFLKTFPDHKIIELDLSEEKNKEDLKGLFHRWVYIRDKSAEESEHEFIAFKRLLDKAYSLSLICIGVYVNSQLVGFAIGELLNKEYSMGHFIKGDTSYIGIFEILYKSIANALYKRGSYFLNIEQDLGIPGLRESKEQWHPINFLKKYIVKQNDLVI